MGSVKVHNGELFFVKSRQNIARMPNAWRDDIAYAARSDIVKEKSVYRTVCRRLIHSQIDSVRINGGIKIWLPMVYANDLPISSILPDCFRPGNRGPSGPRTNLNNH